MRKCVDTRECVPPQKHPRTRRTHKVAYRDKQSRAHVHQHGTTTRMAQAALLKLMAAVAEADKGKPTALFGRAASNRSLFADMAQLPYLPSTSATPFTGGSPHSQTASASPRTQVGARG